MQEAPPDDLASLAGDASASASELAKEQVSHAKEMADVKKKFMSVARRKQQDYNKKVFHSQMLVLHPYCLLGAGACAAARNSRHVAVLHEASAAMACS